MNEKYTGSGGTQMNFGDEGKQRKKIDKCEGQSDFYTETCDSSEVKFTKGREREKKKERKEESTAIFKMNQ